MVDTALLQSRELRRPVELLWNRAREHNGAREADASLIEAAEDILALLRVVDILYERLKDAFIARMEASEQDESCTEFDREDSDAAIATLNKAEREKRPQDEVVLFLSEGEEALRRMHSRYFYDAKGIAAQLREALDAIK